MQTKRSGAYAIKFRGWFKIIMFTLYCGQSHGQFMAGRDIFTSLFISMFNLISLGDQVNSDILRKIIWPKEHAIINKYLMYKFLYVFEAKWTALRAYLELIVNVPYPCVQAIWKSKHLKQRGYCGWDFKNYRVRNTNGFSPSVPISIKVGETCWLETFLI